jgi:Lhr-like helicase
MDEDSDKMIDEITTDISCLEQAGLSKMKVTKPSEIQAAAIPAILSSDNVAMQSYTGSGKVSPTTLGNCHEACDLLYISFFAMPLRAMQHNN